ncbi:hypothetical protein C8J57DRAFT_1016773, partial [Mycena rebaudengoi]
WSLDPSGKDYLSTEQATALGFPSIQFEVWVKGESWKADVYEEFHKLVIGKGFDPESQDAARHFDYPLFHLPGEIE